RDVYLPHGGDFLAAHAMLYMSQDELETLADDLAAIQPFLGRLTRDQSLRGLFSMLASATEAAADGEAIDLAPVFARVRTAMQAHMAGQRYLLSWEEMMLGGEAYPANRRQFIIVQPDMDFSNLLAGGPATRAIRTAASNLHLDVAHGLRMRLTGAVALGYEELISVSRGAGMAAIAAMVLVGIVLLIGLGSLRLVAATLITLILGLILTAGFAAIAIGHLNLISVAFAVLYIGLGVDFAIHLCLRYLELRRDGMATEAAIRASAGDIGTSLVFCTVTTATGFFCFVPTAYAGVSELGVISGTGMFISLILTLTVLPALIYLWRPDQHVTVKHPPFRLPMGLGRMIVDLPVRHKRAVLSSTVLVILAALWLLQNATFDYNPINLREADSESVTTFNDLMDDSDTSPGRIMALYPDATKARRAAARLERLDAVDKTVMIDDFVAADQQNKLFTIEDMGLILGPVLAANGELQAPLAGEQLAAMRELRQALDDYLGQDAALANEARQLRANLDGLLADLRQRGPRARDEALAQLEHSMLDTLPLTLARLRQGLAATPFTHEDLPDEIVERWLSTDGVYRVEVFPATNINGNDNLSRFVAAVRSVAPQATGGPVFTLEAGDAVIGSFKQAFISALIIITLLLLLLLRRLSDTLLVLAPLLLAGTLTAAATVVFDIPFNFANIIALPLLLGIGVDSGIHMVHRAQVAMPREKNLLHTSTARAVLFSTLTTICSFGNLSFSAHRGTASMGLLLTVGVGLTLVCVLLVLPALVDQHRRWRECV
ncbi:MAG: MMPL family transporter, partial [Mariprofundaceae bacterium]